MTPFRVIMHNAYEEKDIVFENVVDVCSSPNEHYFILKFTDGGYTFVTTLDITRVDVTPMTNEE